MQMETTCFPDNKIRGFAIECYLCLLQLAHYLVWNVNRQRPYSLFKNPAEESDRGSVILNLCTVFYTYVFKPVTLEA